MLRAVPNHPYTPFSLEFLGEICLILVKGMWFLVLSICSIDAFTPLPVCCCLTHWATITTKFLGSTLKLSRLTLYVLIVGAPPGKIYTDRTKEWFVSLKEDTIFFKLASEWWWIIVMWVIASSCTLPIGN